MQNDLTQGNLFSNILHFSIPFFLSYFLQTLYGLADLLIVGQYNGADVISAVSIGSQVMHMFTVMIVGLAMGTTVMIGRMVGSKEEEKKRILEKELGLISEIKYQISNTDNKELKEKLQNLLDQIEELKRKDIQLYIKAIKDNYEHYLGEIHELIEAKNMEERIRKFVGNLKYERYLINSQREILKNTIYIKDNTFHSSLESFSKNKFQGKK